ncbi:uncharacterized protein LOC101741197 isoform X3 [Bombyx mori]|uniref:uncharacterized protein LOC101741197 isoform X3 n=1 Tax=Bombyx mori TaxID=7091 RepID=UPI002ED18A20
MSARKRISLEEEYSKPTGITADDIAKLRQWLDTQPHLPKNLTDLDLILIYHKCDRSLQVSKQEIDNQYTLRTLFTSFFKDRGLDKETETFFQTMLVTVLPERSKAGDTIFYGRMLDSDVKNFDFATSIKGIFMALDLWQYEEGTWPGLIFIFDLQGIKMGLLSKLDIQNLQQFAAYFPSLFRNSSSIKTVATHWSRSLILTSCLRKLAASLRAWQSVNVSTHFKGHLPISICTGFKVFFFFFLKLYFFRRVMKN